MLKLILDRRALLVLAVCAMAGCESTVEPNCTAELGVELAPGTRTLRVGESLTPSGTIVTCGGTTRVAADLALSVDDSAVVRISPDAKSLTAVGAGTVHVGVSDPRYGSIGAIVVTVNDH